jgi:hypothetical protein
MIKDTPLSPLALHIFLFSYFSSSFIPKFHLQASIYIYIYIYMETITEQVDARDKGWSMTTQGSWN